MARRPKPWHRAARGLWIVTIDGQQHAPRPHKKAAFDSFYELMRRPRERRLTEHSLATLADLFLEWVQRHRSPETYEWYRYTQVERKEFGAAGKMSLPSLDSVVWYGVD